MDCFADGQANSGLSAPPPFMGPPTAPLPPAVHPAAGMALPGSYGGYGYPPISSAAASMHWSPGAPMLQAMASPVPMGADMANVYSEYIHPCDVILVCYNCI